MSAAVARGNEVKWTSGMSPHQFRGRVVRVFGAVAVIDDGLGLTYRNVPVAKLEVIGGACRRAGRHA